jgi:hypothetical protein
MLIDRQSFSVVEFRQRVTEVLPVKNQVTLTITLGIAENREAIAGGDATL